MKSLFSVKWIVSGATGIVFVLYPSFYVIGFVIGAIANALCSKILKRLWGVSRPPGSVLHDPGMPSSHAQSLFFFASFLSSSISPNYAVSLVFFLAAASCSIWRVFHSLHTWPQIVVGAIIGTLNGQLWWCLLPHVEPYVQIEKVPYLLIGIVILMGWAVVYSIERKLGKWETAR